MAEELKMHLDGPTGAVCTWGPVVYVVWRGLGSHDPIRAADAAIGELTARYGSGRQLLYLHRLPASDRTHRRDPEVLQASLDHFQRQDPYVVAAAVAIETTGFGAAVFRSIGAAVMLVRRTEVKTEMFTDARAGVRWLHTLAGDSNSFDPTSLIVALQMTGLAIKDPRF